MRRGVNRMIRKYTEIKLRYEQREGTTQDSEGSGI